MGITKEQRDAAVWALGGMVNPRDMLAVKAAIDAMVDAPDSPPGPVNYDTDAGFLTWIHERLEHQHGENPNMDYMHKLLAIARAQPKGRRTPNVGAPKAEPPRDYGKVQVGDEVIELNPEKWAAPYNAIVIQIHGPSVMCVSVDGRSKFLACIDDMRPVSRPPLRVGDVIEFIHDTDIGGCPGKAGERHVVKDGTLRLWQSAVNDGNAVRVLCAKEKP